MARGECDRPARQHGATGTVRAAGFRVTGMGALCPPPLHSVCA
ncbi:hypothetical protein ATSB10_28470 [Dyella thiooxydans]|uniref:Uncharacterized protein n=1 Tax=Dyella thiooxydans TaxID=445710 RepID=A0A160N2X7_9GAMM|nr:hypothetical protein ATSB10_28470 [Dyella thiooxydans]